MLTNRLHSSKDALLCEALQDFLAVGRREPNRRRWEIAAPFGLAMTSVYFGVIARNAATWQSPTG